MARRQSKPEYAVVGLGRFGSSLALTLASRGYSVLGIDRDPALVQQLADDLTQTVALDSTNEEALRAVDITSFDTVIVAIGADFENNLMTTVALKAIGVRRVVCKALTERQQAILLKVGADRVVLPEHEAGQRLAYSLIAPWMLEQLPLGANHSIAELRTPAHLIGRSLHEANIPERYGLLVLAIKRGEEWMVPPKPNCVFSADDVLVTLGSNADVARLSGWRE
jgi:trk system potassium uptake protein